MTVLPRAATSPELVKLRSDNQASRLYLTVHQPTTVYSARLAAVPTSTDSVTSITYNSGSGTYTNIISDMTLLVGSTAGGFDYGQCRIRNTTGIGATSGTINVGETSEVNWQAGAYLTVLDEFLLWRRDPRVDSSGAVFMDYDIAYSDQHSHCQSIVVMGPPAVKWLTSTSVTVSFDASNSWCVNNTITAYAWTFPGASATAGTTTATPTATYNAAGTYRAACTITNSDGVSATGYRYVFVLDELSSVPPAMITHFNLDNFSGDYNSGGWSAQITLLDQADLSSVRDRALAIVHTRDWYGPRFSDEGSIGYVADRENIALVGWISIESDKLAPEDKYSLTSFTIQGPQWWLNKMTAFPAGLKDKVATPTKWTRFLGLTARVIYWHILNWRTTAPVMMDCYPEANQWRAARLDAAGAQTVWTQLTTILDNAIIAKMCCDRYSRLFPQIEQNVLDTTTRSSIPTVMSITRADWTNEINFDRRQVDDVGYVDMSGVSFDGTTPTPIFSLAPGHVFKHWGMADVRERLVLFDQATANTLSGAYYGWKNNPYPRFTFELAMNNRLVDLAPYQYMAINIAAGDTPRGFTATGLRLIPRAIRYQWNKRGGFFTTQIEVEAETAINLSVTGDVPTTPPIVPVNPPPPPPPPIPPVPITANDANEAWFATYLNAPTGSVNSIVWAGDFSFSGTSQPTWNKFTALPGGGNVGQYFVVTVDGNNVYYVVGDPDNSNAVTIFQCTNVAAVRAAPATTPTWSAILAVGQTVTTNKIGGGTDSIAVGALINVERMGNNLITCWNGTIGGLYYGTYAEYDGVTWNIYSQRPFTPDSTFPDSIGGLAPRAIYLRGFAGTTAQDFFLYTYNSSMIGFTSVGGSAGGISSFMWRSLGNLTDYYAARNSISDYSETPGQVIVFQANKNGGNVNILGIINTSASIFNNYRYMRGALYGNALEIVDSNTGILWLSEDRATIASKATWAVGVCDESKLSGGGSLTWFIFTATNGNEFIRVSNDRGTTWTACTGNYWTTIQTSGSLAGLTFYPVFH